MCWVSYKKAEGKIAEEDIKVFKIGKTHEDMFCSMYTGFKYQLNQLYTSRIDIEFEFKEDRDRFVGSQGFHSYDPSIVHLEICENVISRWSALAGQKLLDFDTGDANYVKAECVIPEGSVYYENEWGEIISSQIIIKNVESIWN